MVVPWPMALVALAWVVGSVGGAGQVVGACLLPPVAAPVADPYREPACRWCPGNRGLTYATAAGVVVRAAAAGTVAFSGVVAGTRYVVVDHAAGGLRATYGGLASAVVAVGDAVVAGEAVGTAARELHFGLRRGDEYLDPTPLLGQLVPRARLVPTDGTGRRAPPRPRLVCPG